MKIRNHNFFNIKNGFTLAEVLITLVVIGVVAALTIPTAINNTKDQEFKSQFAKAYSTLSQAMYKTIMYDFYGYVDCAYRYDAQNNTIDYSIGTPRSQCPAFYEAFAKNLNVQKICRGNSKADGCVPAYKSYNSGSCGGFSQNGVDNINYSYVLADGQIINTYGAADMPLFLIDINGHKGPNAYGKDLFSFNISRRTDDVSTYFLGTQACGFPVSGGKTTENMIQYALAGKK